MENNDCQVTSYLHLHWTIQISALYNLRAGTRWAYDLGAQPELHLTKS